LVLTQNMKIAANLHLNYTGNPKVDIQNLTNEIGTYVARFGGIGAILYGNTKEPGLVGTISTVQNRLAGEKLSSMGMVIDFVHVDHKPNTTPGIDNQTVNDPGILSEPDMEYDGTYYSPTEKALEAINQNAGTGQQFKAMLLKNGAKQAEMDWMGWDETFKPDQKVTKADIQEWIDQNKVEIKEIILGEPNTEQKQQWIQERVSYMVEQDIEAGESPQDIDYDFLRQLAEEQYMEEVLTEDQINNHLPKYDAYSFERGENYKEWLLTMPTTGDGFKSAHWGQSNVVVHVRTNERIDTQGRKVFFIEEIQSDWSQAGRRKGFYDENKMAELKEQLKAAEAEYSKLDFLNLKLSEVHNSPQAQRVMQIKEEIKVMEKSVPHTPFAKTDQWTNLALRRMMKHAAENGFDAVAMITGDHQVKRFRISKRVDKIAWHSDKNRNRKFIEIKRGKKNVFIEDIWIDNEGTIVASALGSDLEGRNIGEVIGKDLAVKIVREDQGKLSGQEMDIGGDGMRGFYDDILPKAAGKIAKPFGAKVEKINIGTQELVDPKIEEVKWNDETAFWVESDGGYIEYFDTRKEAEAYIDRTHIVVPAVMITDKMREGFEPGVSLFEPPAEYKEKLGSLTPIQQKEAEAKLKGLDARIEELKAKAREANNRLTKKKREIESRRVGQGELFEQPKPQFAGSLFDVENDFSQHNINNILAPIKREISAYQREAQKIQQQKEAIVDSIIEGAKAQQEISFNELAGEYLGAREETPNYRNEPPNETPPPDAPKFAGEALNGQNRMIRGKGEKVREILQDRMLSVRNIQDEVLKRGGRIDDSSNPYVQENLSTSRFKAEAERFNAEIFDPFMEIVAKIGQETGSDLDGIQHYMKAKHAPERNKTIKEKYDREEGSGMSDQEADVIVKAFEKKASPQTVKEFWKAVNETTQYTIDKWMEYGLMSKEAHSEIKGRWQYYVPLQGWKLTEADPEWDYLSNFAGDGFNSIKTAKGRTTIADDPIHNMVTMAHSAIAAGEKNLIKQAAARMVRNNLKMNDLFTFKRVYLVKTGLKDEQGRTMYEETTVKPEQELWDQGLVKTKINNKHEAKRPRQKSEQHEVEVYFDGEKSVLVFTDPTVGNAINYDNQINPELSRFVQGTIGRGTRWLSANFTAKNPAFIPINLIRDFGYALSAHYIKGDAKQMMKFASVAPKARKAIIRHLAGKFDPSNKYDKFYKEFIKAGGETGYVHLYNIDAIKRQIERDYKRLTNTNSVWDKARNARVLKSLGKIMEHYAIRSENLSRFATYVTSRESGKSVQQSAYDAKEITVNFNRKGRATSLLTGLFAFFNAGIQGGQNIVSMGKRHKNKLMGVAAGYMATGFMSAMMNDIWANDDDEEKLYDSLSDFVKYQNLVIPGAKGKFITLPLPHGFRSFHSFGVMAYQYMAGQRDLSHVLLRGTSSIMESLSIIDPTDLMTDNGGLSVRPIVPTVFVPIFDIVDNEDFAGRTIYKEAFTRAIEELTPDSQLGLRNVNPAIKAGTDFLFKAGGGDPGLRSRHYVTGDGQLERVKDRYDWNPSKAEHMLFYYLGGRGQFWNDVIKTTAGVLEGVKDVTTNDKEFHQVLESVDANSMPVLRRLYRTPWTKNYIREYYQIRDDVEAFENLRKQLRENGRYEEYITLSQNEELMIKSRMFKKFEKQVNNLYQNTQRVDDPQVQEELVTIKDELMKDLIRNLNNYNR
jgi:hypothetical protein